MIVTVSISDLRNNIAQYLEQVTKGTRVFVRDEKRDKIIAQISRNASFDSAAYEKALRKAAGIFTADNHPEWKSKEDIVNWLNKTRLANDRKF
jgi:antitoxin (DNA-binding transcriptional repressor) of toxin-antitoxin stability system